MIWGGAPSQLVIEAIAAVAPVAINASLTDTLAGLTLAGTAAPIVGASLAGTIADLTLAGTAGPIVGTNLADTIADLTLAGTAAPIVGTNLGETIADLSLAGSGSVLSGGVSANLAETIADLRLAATVVVPHVITPIGVGTATLYPKLTSAGAPLANLLVAPGNTGAPILFEPPSGLSGGDYEVWLIASGGANWGGCQVWISTDGNTYALAGTVYKGARQGLLSAALASHSDPDTVGTLSVDLTESLGQLLSGTQADADNFVTLCYCDGELLSYETAALTASYKYNLTYLRRGAYGTAIGSHSAGANFARFGPNDPSLFRYRYPASFVGQTIHVKLPAFNIFGQELQSLAGLTADTYTLTGSGALGATTVPIQFLGIPQIGAPITRYTFGEAVGFAAALAGSVATAGTASTGTVIFDIAKNAANFATMTFAASASASFAGSAQTFASGDLVTITPRSTDATLANLSGYLAGTS